MQIEQLWSMPKFSFHDFTKALNKIANITCADQHGIVIEMIKYSSVQLKHKVLACFNRCIEICAFDDERHHSVFMMLPKSGDLIELSN